MLASKRCHRDAMALNGNPRRRSLVGGCVLAALFGASSNAAAQTPPRVTVSVDATSPGAPIERVWAMHGFDEVNYATTPPGVALLDTLAQIHRATPHIRNHFLLNTGDGTPSFKWGSTNVYTAGGDGSAAYDWTLMDGIMDTITGAGARDDNFQFTTSGSFQPLLVVLAPDATTLMAPAAMPR